LAISLAGPATATAQPATTEPEPATAAPEDTLAEAKARHLEAEAKYNTADYEGAIESWQEAFAALPRTGESNTYRSVILYNIAAAREKLFELRGDVEHLKQAKILLEQFEGSIDETYAGLPEEAATVRAQVEAKLTRIDAMITKAQHDAATTKPPPGPVEEAEPPPPETKRRDPARAMVIGGSVAIGIGVLGLAGMTAAMVVGNRANDLGGVEPDDLDARENKFDRGRAANAGAIAAGVIGGAALAAGIALVVVGTKRRANTTAFAPMLGRGLAGLGFAGRF
jgi:hypothetical protein